VFLDTLGQATNFKGKERDTETGNDDFGARYYSNRFGRWLSADWSAVPVPVPYANLTNPQTLNLYSMVSDDPESFADLDGHACESAACDFFSGFVNALASDNSVAPRKDAGGDSTFAVGQAAGDAVATLQGVGQFLLGGAGIAASTGVEVGSGGTATILAIPAGVGSAVFAADGALTATKGAANLGAAAGTLLKSSFKPTDKAAAKEAAGGKCEYCGKDTVKAEKSQKGVTPPKNEAQTDHYDPNGPSDQSNAVHSCRDCNREKSNTPPQGTKWELPRKK